MLCELTPALKGGANQTVYINLLLFFVSLSLGGSLMVLILIFYASVLVSHDCPEVSRYFDWRPLRL